MALVTRDPFAREELHRRQESAGDRSCRWCGNVRHTRSGHAYLYRYRVETDGGRSFTDRELFCSKGCRDAYHD